MWPKIIRGHLGWTKSNPCICEMTLSCIKKYRDRLIYKTNYAEISNVKLFKN